MIVLVVIAALLVFAGAVFALQPLPMLALIAAGLFFWMCLSKPSWALGAFLFVHIAFPIYIRVPSPLSVPPSIGMLAALTAAGALAAALGAQGPTLRGRERLFIGVVVLFGLMAMLSLFDPRTTGDSVNMWIKAFVFPGLVMWVIVRTLKNEADIDHMFQVMLAAACVTAVYGLYEYTVGSNYLFETFMDPAAPERTMYRTDDILGPSIAYRAFSVSSQPIEYGAWLSMLFPYALVRVARAPNGTTRLLFAAACAVLVLGMLVTFSRGCMLALIAVSVLLGIIIRPLRPWLGAGAATLLLAFVIVWPLIADKVTHRVDDLDNVTLRFKMWQAAAAIFGDHPLMGAGFGNFPQYQIEAIRTYRIGPFTEFGQGQGDLVGVAESTYIQLAAETGVVGLATFSIMIIVFFVLTVRLARTTSNVGRHDLALCVGFAALAYLVNGLTITAYTHYVITLLLVGAMFGFVLVLLRAERSEGSTNDPTIKDRNLVGRSTYAS